jgi:hypothetical protein
MQQTAALDNNQSVPLGIVNYYYSVLAKGYLVSMKKILDYKLVY